MAPGMADSRCVGVVQGGRWRGVFGSAVWVKFGSLWLFGGGGHSDGSGLWIRLDSAA